MKKFICDAIIFAGGSLISFSSCKKNDVTAATTTLSAIKADPSLTIFSAIESRSGDDNLVNNSISILVPVDSAFINAGVTASIAATLSQSACDSIVKYYALPNTVSFNGAGNQEVSFNSDLGPSLYIDSTATALYFDGVAATSATPTIVGTAAIYKITHFISPPATSVAKIAASDTSLTLFNEAFNRTGLAANFASGSFTLFMPTNTAFANAGYPDIPSIDAADITALTQILLYHSVVNNYFDNDLAGRTSLTTLQGGTIQISNNGSLLLIGNSSSSLPATVLNSGIIAGNVVTYKINNLLLP